MPLTSKGEKIQAAMKEQYGSEKGEQVFYASRNKGRITGVDAKSDTIAMGALPKADGKKAKGDAEYSSAMTPAEWELRRKQVSGEVPGGTTAATERNRTEFDPIRDKDLGRGWVDTRGDAALKRAEAAIDEDRLLDKASAHCDAISRRMDDCEKKMVRNGERDDAAPLRDGARANP